MSTEVNASGIDIDINPIPGSSLANGTGLASLGADASQLDIDSIPVVSDGLATGG